jgi:hypothetical protein
MHIGADRVGGSLHSLSFSGGWISHSHQTTTAALSSKVSADSLFRLGAVLFCNIPRRDGMKGGGGIYVIPLCSFVWYTHPDFFHPSNQDYTANYSLSSFCFFKSRIIPSSHHHRCGFWVFLGPRRLTIKEELQSQRKKCEDKSGSVLQSTALLVFWLALASAFCLFIPRVDRKTNNFPHRLNKTRGC